MVIVSRARCLPPADGDSIEPLASKIVQQVSTATANIAEDDLLLGWFNNESAMSIRCIEARAVSDQGELPRSRLSVGFREENDSV
jgi:hypothetical protein